MIIRGTTPPIRFTFSTVNPLEMTAAFLTVRQKGVTIEKDLSSAFSVTDSLIEWKLTQEETLALEAGNLARVQCRYKFENGTVGASRIYDEKVYAVLKEGEI